MSQPIYYHSPVMPVATTFAWPWIIVIIILILVIIALVIWLIVRHSDNNDNNDFNRLVTIQGGAIRSSSSSITGSWKNLSNETDTVTLYVSTSSPVFGSNGVVICTSPGCSPPASATGSNNQVSISNLTPNTTYNAVLVATGTDTVSYAIYGPIKVFTQETAQVTGILFNIKDLNNPTGSVSNIGSYTETSTDVGTFRYGLATSANSASKSFLIRSDTDTEANPLILCRAATTANPLSTTVVLAEWTNPDSITVSPLIYTHSADQVPGNQIQVSSCQWSYNDEPPADAEGRNAWCLTALQSTNVNNSTLREPLCMARNGGSLALVTPSQATMWYNQQVFTILNP